MLRPKLFPLAFFSYMVFKSSAQQYDPNRPYDQQYNSTQFGINQSQYGPHNNTYYGGQGPPYQFNQSGGTNRDQYGNVIRDPNNRDPNNSFNRDPNNPYNRDPNNPYNRDPSNPYNRDPNSRDPNNPYNRDPNNPYNRDPNNRDPNNPYNRDPNNPYSRDPYNRDHNGSYNRDPNDPYSRDRDPYGNHSYNGSHPYNRDQYGFNRDPNNPYNRDQYNSTFGRDPNSPYNRDPYNRDRDQYNRDPNNRDPNNRDPNNRDQYNRDRDQYGRDPNNRDQYNSNRDQYNQDRGQQNGGGQQYGSDTNYQFGNRYGDDRNGGEVYNTNDNCCHEYCYTQDEAPSLDFATKTPYQVVYRKQSEQHKIPDCEPVQFWSINRHGTRFPSARTISRLRNLNRIHDEIVRNYEERRSYPDKGKLCRTDFDLLRRWRWNQTVTEQNANGLTSQGVVDMKYLARRYASKFEQLFREPYNQLYYNFQYTEADRTHDSYQAYIEGLFANDAYQVHANVYAENRLMRPTGECIAYQREVEHNPDTYREYAKFTSSQDYQQMIRDVFRRLGFRYTLKAAVIEDMYDLCRYEKAWDLDSRSPWCTAFNKEQLKLLEYGEDLKSYYTGGYGSDTNRQVGCPLVKDLYEKFENTVGGNPGGNKVSAYFTHSTTMQTFLAAMDVNKDHQPLTGDNYHQQSRRKWRTSVMNPFAANLAAVLYQWRWNQTITEQNANGLTSQGITDMKYLARRYASKFEQIFREPYNQLHYNFQYTDSDRTHDSYQAYIEGLFRNNAYQVHANVQSDNRLMRPTRQCNAYQREVEHNPDTYREYRKFTASQEYQQMVRDVFRRLGFRYTLNASVIDDMYDLCRYEKAWDLDRHSPWCTVFNKEQLKLLEYAEDLKYYYTTGYGNEINKRVGCPSVKDLYEKFESTVNGNSGGNKVSVFFTHSASLQTFLTAMGMNKDYQPLTADNYHQQSRRKWRTSTMDPFASNLAAVLYQCRTGERHRVMFFLNEVPVDYPDCSVGLCNWSTVKQKLQYVAEGCSLDFCDQSGGSTVAVYGYAISVVMALFVVALARP